jgi:AcrR family transcriptional regulator
VTAPAEPRWRRLEPDERRDQILAAAVRHFGERPYPEVGVKEIAADAGVARALVNHYFGTKRELYLAAGRAMMFVPPLTHESCPGGTRIERVEAVIGWLLGIVEAHGHSWLAMAGAGGPGADPEVQALLDEADDLAADRVLEIVEFDGTPKQRAAARAAVRGFGGMVKATGRELIERKSMTSAQAHRQLTVALDAVLSTLSPDDSPRPAPAKRR